MGDPVVVESWHVPRALSDKALRLLTSLPMEEIERRLRVPMAADGEVIEGQLISGWLPIDTAPRDGTEILASDCNGIEIVSWKVCHGLWQDWVHWFDRDGRIMSPAWWQPLPDHPPLPEVE